MLSNSQREQLIQQTLEAMGGVFRSAFSHLQFPHDSHRLTRPQIHLLFHVSRSKDGVSVKELAEAMQVTSAAITQFTDELVAQELLERHEDPNDRRSVRLVLSQKAHDSFRLFKRRYFERVCPAFQKLTDSELRRLSELVGKIEPVEGRG